MKLLYLSCHSILEYDELALLESLNVDYFSLGSYIIPTKPVDGIRPALTHIPDEWCAAHAPMREALPREFVDRFDTIVIMHKPEWIETNWEVIKDKRVFWRTIGQSTPSLERRLWPYRQQGLKVIRYSPMEANLIDNIGCDKVIRFYKDPDEFFGWNGANAEVITFAQDMEHRDKYCNYKAFTQIVQGLNAHVYGPKNEGSGSLNGGFLTYEGMKQKMRDARVYVYTGTQPASYTLNFMEALMTGIPMVCIGPQMASTVSAELGINTRLYEIPEIITNGVNGFWSDDINELRSRVEFLLNDPKAAARIGELGRQKAIELFGKKVIQSKWKELLNV